MDLCELPGAGRLVASPTELCSQQDRLREASRAADARFVALCTGRAQKTEYNEVVKHFGGGIHFDIIGTPHVKAMLLHVKAVLLFKRWYTHVDVARFRVLVC